jgi:hypothetical protein
MKFWKKICNYIKVRKQAKVYVKALKENPFKCPKCGHQLAWAYGPCAYCHDGMSGNLIVKNSFGQH